MSPQKDDGIEKGQVSSNVRESNEKNLVAAGVGLNTADTANTDKKESNGRQAKSPERKRRRSSSSSAASRSSSNAGSSSSGTSSSSSQAGSSSSASSSSASSSDESSSTSASSSSAQAADSGKGGRKKARGKLGNDNDSDKPGAPRKIHVGKLTRNITKEHVKEIFSTYGTVKNVMMPMDRVHSHLNRGYAYVEYQTGKQAEMASKFMNEAMVDGQPINVALILPAPAATTNTSSRPITNDRRSPLSSKYDSQRWNTIGGRRKRPSPIGGGGGAYSTQQQRRRYSRSSTRSN